MIAHESDVSQDRVRLSQCDEGIAAVSGALIRMWRQIAWFAE
jgi:hypothetical protein